MLKIKVVLIDKEKQEVENFREVLNKWMLRDLDYVGAMVGVGEGKKCGHL